MEFIKSKALINKTKSKAWFGFDYNMNIYRGCCHGCIYCDSRSQCYGIKDFHIVKAKENPVEKIRNDLRKKNKTGVIGMGAMSDPYNPFEEKTLFTRNALEVIHSYGFGVAIMTKSSLIERDIDIIKKIQKHSPVIVLISITTYEDELSRKIEPNASLVNERFKSIKKLSNAGIYTGVLLMPVLPFINDNIENILSIVRKSKEVDAKCIYSYFGVTLRNLQREYYYKKLDKLFPGLKEKYIEKYGDRYSCISPNAIMLKKIFKEECEKLEIEYKMKKIIHSYKSKYEYEQISFF